MQNMMWPGHVDHEFNMNMEAQRNAMANMLHVPLAMSLCRVDYSNLKMQSQMNNLNNHMYPPSAFEGILELRKEKSRDAARSRRGKENYEFYELAKLLPLPTAITTQLDKASIIRLTISYLKLRDFSSHGDPPWTRDGPASSNGSAAAKASSAAQRRNSLGGLGQDVFETHQGTHILQSLDGFAFALSNDGRFLYISETVSIYLGLSQVEMAGSSIFEYIHSHDHKEVAEQLGLNAPKGSFFASSSSPDSSDDESSSSAPPPPRSTTPNASERVSVMSPNPSKGYDRCFCIRMKSTLTKRGVHFKSSGYRVVQIVAHLRPQISFPATARKQLPPLLGLVGMAIALPPPTITELIIDNDMFVTRLSPQLKVTYCEPRISDMMDMTSEDLLNKNLYDHCHAEDLEKLHKAHMDLLNKGQVLTDYYRLMNRHGGYIWIQTCATIICNAKNAEEQNIIAINYVLSGVEYAGCIMNLDQYRVVNKQDPEPSTGYPTATLSDMSSRDKDDTTTTAMRHREKSQAHPNGLANSSEVVGVGATITSPSSSTSSKMSHKLHALSDTGSRRETEAVGFLRTGHSSSAPDDGDDESHAIESSPRLDGDDADSSKKTDSKNNSRRKMDKPRKRKRPSTVIAAPSEVEADSGAAAVSASEYTGRSEGGGGEPKILKIGILSGTGNGNPSVTRKCEMGTKRSDEIAELSKRDNPRKYTKVRGSSDHVVVKCAAVSTSSAVSSSESDRRVTSSPTAEDLSTVYRSTSSPQAMDVPMQATDSSPLLHRTSSSSAHISSWNGLTSVNNYIGSGSDNDDILTGGCSGGGKSGGGGGGATSSVLDLEEAMNKHLPAPLPGSMQDEQQSPYGHYGHTGGSLLGMQRHKWMSNGCGSHLRESAGVGGYSTSDLSTASLLRSMYPSRESVIRTNVYGSRGGVGGGGSAMTGIGGGGASSLSQASAASQYYSNIQNALLTPPSGGGGCGGGNDFYKESFAASLLNHSRSAAVGSSNGYHLMNSGSYMSGGGGGGGTPTLSMSDAYAMTPPSSVSPQESHSFLVDHLVSSSSAVLNGGDRDSAAAAAMMQAYCGLPLRPHAYSLSAAAAAGAGGGYDQQAMTPYQGYYSAAAASTYHCMAGAGAAAAAVAAAHYRDHAMKSSNGW